MAIDTAIKRRQALNAAIPVRAFLPIPDSSIDKIDRSFVWFMYFEAKTPSGTGESFFYRNYW